jgi:hypothetical protein
MRLSVVRATEGRFEQEVAEVTENTKIGGAEDKSYASGPVESPCLNSKETCRTSEEEMSYSGPLSGPDTFAQ